MDSSDIVIELNLKNVFPGLWINIYKLRLLLGENFAIALKYKRDLIFIGDRVFIVDTRSSLKRVGGNTFLLVKQTFIS